MRRISLENATDVATVWANWHGDVLVIIDNGIQKASESGNQVALAELQSVKGLLERPPVQSEHFINIEVMEDNAEVISSVIYG